MSYQEITDDVFELLKTRYPYCKGIGLTGSLLHEYKDQFSDIDFYVFMDAMDINDRTILRIFSDSRSSLRVSGHFLEEKCPYKGIPVSIKYIPLDELHTTLTNKNLKFESYFWSFTEDNTKILHDSEGELSSQMRKIHEALDEIKPLLSSIRMKTYPPAIYSTILQGYYRGLYHIAQDCQNIVSDVLIDLAYLSLNEIPPTRKWRLHPSQIKRLEKFGDITQFITLLYTLSENDTIMLRKLRTIYEFESMIFDCLYEGEIVKEKKRWWWDDFPDLKELLENN